MRVPIHTMKVSIMSFLNLKRGWSYHNIARLQDNVIKKAKKRLRYRYEKIVLLLFFIGLNNRKLQQTIMTMFNWFSHSKVFFYENFNAIEISMHNKLNMLEIQVIWRFWRWCQIVQVVHLRGSDLIRKGWNKIAQNTISKLELNLKLQDKEHAN